MHLRKLTHIALAVLLVVAFVAAVAPTVAAQKTNPSVTVSLTPVSEPVKPLQGQIVISGKVTFVSEGTARTGLVGVPVTIEFTEKPAWANVIISPSSAVITLNNENRGEVDFKVTVTATDQAPAFQLGTIKIQATSTEGAAFAQARGTDSVGVQADFFSIVDVQLLEAIKVDRPQTPVMFPVKITNLGNANTKVTFEITGKPDNLQVPVPAPVTLQSRQAGGTLITADVQLTVQTPYQNGYLNEVGVVNYKVTSAYALDNKIKGDESTLSVVVTTKGFYVPGFEPLLLVGLLGAAAIVMRRPRS